MTFVAPMDLRGSSESRKKFPVGAGEFIPLDPGVALVCDMRDVAVKIDRHKDFFERDH